MTQHLETLKEILQKVLSGSVEHEDFKEGLRDCIYACDLMSETALQQHIDIWLDVGQWDLEYVRGLQFVAEQWDKVLSEDNEGEVL